MFREGVSFRFVSPKYFGKISPKQKTKHMPRGNTTNNYPFLGDFLIGTLFATSWLYKTLPIHVGDSAYCQVCSTIDLSMHYSTIPAGVQVQHSQPVGALQPATVLLVVLFA